MTPIENTLLREPDVSFIDQIAEYRSRMMAAGSSMEGCGPLSGMGSAVAWLREVDLLRRRDTVPSGCRQATQFIFVREENHEIVGMIQVVHSPEEGSKGHCGSISFSVAPAERQKGYGAEMLNRCLRFCSRAGMTHVTLTCGADNAAARKVIQRNGGIPVTGRKAGAADRLQYRIDLSSGGMPLLSEQNEQY